MDEGSQESVETIGSEQASKILVDKKLENEEEELKNEEEADPRDFLTKEQVDYWKTIFDWFDAQKKQKIPVKAIGYSLRLMGLNPTKLDIKNHILQLDPYNQGLIDFQSFLLPIAQKINEEPETHEDIIAAFRIFDEGGNGYVYSDKLIDYLTSMGEDLEDFEIDSFLKAADPKGLNKVYYEEFVEKLMGIDKKSKTKGKKNKKKK